MNTQVGFTNPSVTYEKMRHTDTSARIMNDDVRNYVLREAFKTAWSAWYARWRAFFDKTMDEKFSNVFKTDEIAAQAEAYRQDLARFQATYKQERDANGQPLPSNTPDVPITPPPDKEDEKSTGIPLWALLVGLGVVGAGVGVYYVMKKQYQLAEKALPLLPSILAPEATLLSKAATSHDVSGRVQYAFAKAGHDVVARPMLGGDCGCQRDLDIRAAEPRAFTKYILSGS